MADTQGPDSEGETGAEGELPSGDGIFSGKGPGDTDTPSREELVALVVEARAARDQAVDDARVAGASAQRCTAHENTAYTKGQSAQSYSDRAANAIKEVEQAKTDIAAAREAALVNREEINKLSAEAVGKLEVLNGHQAAAKDAAAAAVQARTAIETLATQTSERSKHIQQGKEHADEVRSHLDGVVSQVTATLGKTTTLAGEAQSGVTEVQKAVAAIESLRQTATTVTTAITESGQRTKGHEAAAKALADKADAVDAKLAAYEKELAEIAIQFQKQRTQIESLLPGATSAGLASAFERRGVAFKWPEYVWQAIFLGSITGLILIAYNGGETAKTDSTIPAYEEMLRNFLHRLPFLVPLVWLAVYAARQSALAKRLEEEYGFKAAIARSFEGFRKQMSDVGKDSTLPTAVIRLHDDTLEAIYRQPGRIYDKHRPDVSPGTAIAETARPLANSAAKIFPGQGVD